MIQRETVEDGRRAVIYRNGRFSRLAGPGVVTILTGIDTIQRFEDVRNRPLDYYVDGLFPQDLPMSITVNLWARFDPETIAGNNKKRLRDLMLLPPRERNEQVVILLRDALMRATRAVNEKHHLPKEASPLDRVFPIAPPGDLHDEMIEAATEDLTPRLLRLGLILDRSLPMRITQIEISEADRQSFMRDRVATRLRQRFPNLSDTALAQLVAAFEGQLPLHVQDIHIEGAAGAQLEASTADADGKGVQVTFPFGTVTPPPTTPPAAVQPERLSKSDLQVLKPVPAKSSNSRRAA